MSKRFLLALTVLALTTVLAAQEPKKENVTVPEAETNAAKAVQAAADPAAKLTAAEAFVKKYPKSVVRKQVADYLVEQLAVIKDPKQKLALSERYEAIFNSDAETNAIKPVQFDAYIESQQFDDAFATGERILAQHPDDVRVLSNLAITATEQAKKGNATFISQGSLHGGKAIELIEADKKPADMDAATWSTYKGLLPKLYQEMAILALLQRNMPDAQTKLEKAATLNPTDPFNFMVLANITNDQYQEVAKTYQAKPTDELKAKANQLMDQMLENYGKAAAMSEGKPEYQPLHDQVVKDMTPYYKYRHNNSTDGLQEFINKYKKP